MLAARTNVERAPPAGSTTEIFDRTVTSIFHLSDEHHGVEKGGGRIDATGTRIERSWCGHEDASHVISHHIQHEEPEDVNDHNDTVTGIAGLQVCCQIKNWYRNDPRTLRSSRIAR